MAKIKVTPEYKKIVKMFNDLTGSRSLWQVFNDCIELYALSFQNIFTFGKKHNDNENRYNQIIQQYTDDEVSIILRIFAELTNMATDNPFRDLLGDLYMQLNMGSDALGQFFTPYPLSYVMAKTNINIEFAKSEITKKGYMTISEPACGGGANVIAACEHLQKNDINYQNQCIIVCQDLSRLTAMMCYVVLSLIGCSAVIKRGDTLSDPFTNYFNEVAKGSEIWSTPMFHINNCYCKV